MLAAVTHRRAAMGLLVLASLLLVGARFRGCEGGDRPDDGTTLPESTGGCLVDDDCVSSDMCVDLVCALGECVDSGRIVDGDGDRFAPIPCGEDCDDGLASVFPGATELCDGLDQDCDERIDEGAPGIRATELPFDVGRARIVGMDRLYAVVGISDAMELIAFVVDPDGPVGEVSVLETVDDPTIPFDADRDAGELSVVVGGSGEPRLYVGTHSGTELSFGGPASFTADMEIEAIDLALFGGQRWVAYDTGAGQRVVLRGVADRFELERGSRPPVLATDGRLVAVTDANERIRFYAPDGVEVGVQTMPGLFSARGLASGDGVVYACYRDAFDHALTRVSPTSFTSPVTAPFGDPADQVSLFFQPPRLMVTRVGGERVGAWLFDATLATYEATFEMEDLSPTGLPPSSVWSSTSGDGLGVIVASYPVASTSIAYLECR